MTYKKRTGKEMRPESPSTGEGTKEAQVLLGAFNRLRVVKRVDFGLYLDGGQDGEILLPSRYVPQDTRIGDEIEVFIYLDQDEPQLNVLWLKWATSPFCNVHG